MRLTLSAYIFVQREEGRSVYVCQPLRGHQITTRDPLLKTALAKLGNKLRKAIHDWIRSGKTNRIGPWLYDSDMRTQAEKLTLVLRDRTLRWKLLFVAFPEFERYVVFSPSIPEVAFEVDSLSMLEQRATEVYTQWAQSRVATEENFKDSPVESSEMWVEPLEIDVDADAYPVKKPQNALAALFGGEKISGSEELHKVGQCLDDVATDFEPALGRRQQVEEISNMLRREDRQGVLVVGPTAVGKSAIIRECAKRRARHFQEKRGHKPQVWWLSPQRLISGMSYLGQWEQRWLAILREATRRDHILYFDDLVGLFTAGRTRDSSLSAADVLRSYLSEHRVRILAESTDEQLAILRRRDRALIDRFHLVHVPTLSSADALPIVLESTYHVETQAARFFHPETVPLIMRHQEIYAPDQAFPGKAIEMTKTLAKHTGDVVDRSVFYKLAGAQVGANPILLLGRLGDRKAIQSLLDSQLIGQPDATSALSRTVVRFAQHLQPTDRPLGVLLFLGPTGVGKTESAKALTRLLYQDDSHLVRLDMNELTTPLAAEQLVGTFDNPEGRLTTAVRRNPNCVILLDEIEKAHPDVFDYLLQVIGEGRLTDARGRVADFRSSIILMTSNLGASEQTSSLGFDTTAERRNQIYRKAAQSFFRPEFLNRIDDIVAFRRLDSGDMEKIVRIQMDEVLSRDGLERRDIYVHITAAAVSRVIQTGFDSQLGARAVRRMLESKIIGPLADCLAALPLDSPALVQITDARDSSQLRCRVTELTTHTPPGRDRLSDLPRLVEAGDVLYHQLDERLNDIADELHRTDEKLGGTSHLASYYALREQVYRCSELLKAGKVMLRQRREPKLDFNAGPSARPRRDLDGSSSKQQLRDWLAQEDLRSAVSDTTARSAADTPSPQRLARQIVDSLAIATAMVDFALAGRTWLIGFQSLTHTAETSTEPSVGPPLNGEHELLGSPIRFLSRLTQCLRHRWQYEVSTTETPVGFTLASGVSLLGILKPLLGTYRSEIAGKPKHLSVLRAIPVQPDASALEIEQLCCQTGFNTDEGELGTPAAQDFPWHQIRGVIGQPTVDFVSGATLQLASDDWFRTEKILDQHLKWWIECLPVPIELLES